MTKTTLGAAVSTHIGWMSPAEMREVANEIEWRTYREDNGETGRWLRSWEVSEPVGGRWQMEVQLDDEELEDDECDVTMVVPVDDVDVVVYLHCVLLGVHDDVAIVRCEVVA